MKTENMPQSASEKAAVMLAFDRGEKVEVRSFGSKIWIHDSNPTWDWQCYEWRVMAKPIEGWVWVYAGGTRGDFIYDSKHKTEHTYNGILGRAVFMREVI